MKTMTQNYVPQPQHEAIKETITYRTDILE